MGRHRVPVHLLLPRGRTNACASRYCAAIHALPPPPTSDQEEEGFVAALVDVAARLADRHGERPVMLFTWERYMLLVARHRERLEPVLHLDLAANEALDRTIDKRRFATHAEAAGLPVPASMVVSSAQDLDRVRSLALPVFLKPPTNMSWGQLPAKLGITDKGARVQERSRLEELLGAFLTDGRAVIVQEYVEGPDYDHASVHSYRDPATGRFLAVCTVRRVRVYPAGAGLGCFVVSENLPELVGPSRGAVEAMGITGSSSVQWKRDRRHGWRILEIGPRLALPMGIGDAVGVNIPLIAYRSLLGQEVETPRQRYGPAWLDLGHDWVSMREYRRNGEWSLARWLWSLRKVRACAFFDPRDPKPWFHQLRYHAAY